MTQDDDRRLLQHFLAALAYRTQKALRGADPHFGSLQAGGNVRTPAQLVCHMTSVLGYARTFIVGGRFRPDPLPSLRDEVIRFHQIVEDLSGHFASGAPFIAPMTPERMLQGPLADAMTHAGQLAMLRRMAGDPVAPENFIFAEIDAERLGPDQPEPAMPDAEWPEAPGPAPRTNRSIPASTVIPVLVYGDVREAATWLCRAFGFTERLRIADHRIQLNAGSGHVVVRDGGPVAPSGHSLMVRIADIDAHCRHAADHGGKILNPPTDYPYGERQYTAEDIGGHRWTFSQSIADVDPADWGGVMVE